MKSVCFHGSKSKFVRALLFCSFHEIEATTPHFLNFAFIYGKAYPSEYSQVSDDLISGQMLKYTHDGFRRNLLSKD